MRVIHENAKIGIVFSDKQHVYDRMLGQDATQYVQLYSSVAIKKYVPAMISIDGNYGVQQFIK